MSDVGQTPSAQAQPADRLEFEREKWEAEKALRERELRLREDDAARSRWLNPVSIAIFTAAAAALANLGVSLINGQSQANTERVKAEQALVLEAIKTTPDKAAENLEFLVQAGLITEEGRRRSISAYLKARQKGEGPSLPSADGSAPETAVRLVSSLPPDDPGARAGAGVGVLVAGGQRACSAFLIGPDLIVTASYCVQPGKGHGFRTTAGKVIAAKADRVVGPDQERFQGGDNLEFATLRLAQALPGPFLRLDDQPPRTGDRLLIVHHGQDPDGAQRVAGGQGRCVVLQVLANTIAHRCRTGYLSGGAPIIREAGGAVVGIVSWGDDKREYAVRGDRIRQGLNRQ